MENSQETQVCFSIARPTIKNRPNGPIDLIPMPSALLACRLRSSLGCQKQVGIGHRGR